jgi:uncharacterized protein YqgC (DUF456 family)
MNELLDIGLFGLTQLFMLVGLFGLVVPVFPGIVVMWLAALGYGLLGGWSTLGIVIFVFLTLLMILGTTVDNLLMGVGARRGGASWLSIGLALLFGIAGTLLWPPIGGIIAAPLSVLLLEYLHRRNWSEAWSAFRGLATGWGLSFVVRFGIGVVMMLLWWLWVWKG